MSEESTRPLRLFISIPVPESVHAALEKAQRELREGLPPRVRKAVRWTNPGQLHLTLRFLGDVEENRVPGLLNALRETCRQFPPLHLRAECVGFFPERRLPRVAWIGVHDRAKLLTPLQQKIETAVHAFSASPATEEFKGHLTIGRIRDLRPSDADTLREAAQKLSAPVFGEWIAEDVHLMQSQLLPQGALHTFLGTATLAAPAPPPK
jgi:RNA 2',3'-cyclic 3'-phosphodiesterase